MSTKNESLPTVAVVGLGYVGLPVALRSVEKGYLTYGLELDEKKVTLIKKGHSPLKEDFVEKRKNLLKKIKVSTNPTILKKADIVIVCVPTPVDKQFYPVLKPLKNAVRMIAKNNKPAQLIVIESTINPGICEDVLVPILEKAGLKPEKDYFLAHCPERIDPGNKQWNVTNIPRVLGATSPKGLYLAKQFYNSIIDAPIKPMHSIREAEAVKVVENSFRDVNIAFVNELAKSFDRMHIDVKDVIDGAATKPFSFLAHYPGRGVGGHCIPVDPYYLIEKAKEVGFDHQFLRVARGINNSMPLYTVGLLQNILNELKMPLKGTKVGVLGLAYKANTDDLRESPSLKIIQELERKKAKVIRFDPFLKTLSDAPDLKTLLKKVDVLILVTNHQEFLDIPPEEFKRYHILAIVDGMNCLAKNKIKRLGIKYHGIGRR